MVNMLGENILKVFDALELSTEEIKWLCSCDLMSICSIVNRAYSPDSAAERVAADGLIDSTFQTMLAKIVLIGCYFIH